MQSARPVMNSSDTVPVEIQFSLMHIKELDVRSQVLTTTGLLILQWVDERLRWDPREYNNLTQITIEAKHLWQPEFVVINGAERVYKRYGHFRAILSHDGSIRWEPGGAFKTMCQIDITYYPFDDQLCSLVFGAWSYRTSNMNLTSPSAKINLDSYKANGEWQITTTEVQRNEFFYGCCPNERFSNVAFRIHLRRRYTYYILNVILPSILTSVLLLSIFFCTPGQKVQIGVVVLLSFRIFLLNVADNIPKTSDHVPLLGIYLTCTMAITTLSMVLTVFVLNLHHMGDRPVPPWVTRIVLVHVARAVGIRAINTADRRKPTCADDAEQTFRPSSKQPRHAVLVQRVDSARPVILALRRTGQVDAKIAGGANVSPDLETADECHNGVDETSRSPGDYTREWQNIAEVFDRLFFWLFLIATVVTTLVLFHPLTDLCTKRLT
ncbi:hypothetical protein NP493_711g03120 [Ridgeia piscesae]|uniref:Uncharacterized protein n=1 Tax=Ridgeia piscesae TaxID=27915 RepID=A0AAD9KQY1_RIDPI|nr:hypothetical protein NP493_711g03120 [Ridgeia piscesae]